MNKSSGQRSFIEELERAEVVLQELLSTLTNLNSVLQPLEHEMKVSDFASSGEFVQGLSNGVVCVLSALIKGDPLEKVLTKYGRGGNIPALIKAGDRTESKMIVESILDMLHAANSKRSLEFMLNLRWAELPSPLEKDNVVILGTRYVSAKPIRLMKLESKLKELGFKVLRDKGEFGGGPLAYEVIRSFRNKHDFAVMELTLSRKVVENDISVIQILKMLASL